MYHLDPNINTAVERQADRMHAVRAVLSNSNSSAQPTAPSWTNRQSQTIRITAKVMLAVTAATPIVLMLAWAVATR